MVGDPKVIPVDILTKVLYVQELHKQIRLRTNTWSNAARLFAGKFDARLTGIVILADRQYFDIALPGDPKIA